MPQKQGDERMETLVILDLRNGFCDGWRVGKKFKDQPLRAWMIDDLKDYRVILTSTQPWNEAGAILRRIAEETGWVPNDFYFNDGKQSNMTLKRHILCNILFRKYGGPLKNEWVAIDEDPRTQRLYASFGVKNLWIEDGKIMTDAFDNE